MTLALETLQAKLKSRAALLEVLFVTGYLIWLAVTLFRFAALRPLWYDELFTLQLARVASPVDLLGHLAAGVDLNPPLIYFTTRLSILTFGETLWAVRLPALLGMLLGLACFYSFMRKLRGPAVAFLAIVAVVATPKVFAFFIEARPYGLAFGFAGLALLSRQRRCHLWLALACFLGISSHYYFSVFIGMLGLAEVISQYADRRFDWKPFAAMMMGGVALAACYPLWSVAPKEYAAGFWAKVTFSRMIIQEAFWQFAEPSLTIPLLLSVTVALLFGNTISEGAAPRVPPLEFLVLILIAASPFLAVYLGAKLTGGMHYRYILPAAFGFAGLFALGIDRIGGGQPLACVLSAAAFLFIGIPYSPKPYKEFFNQQNTIIREQANFLVQYTHGEFVILENGYEFANQWHAHRAGSQPAFLADPERALAVTKVDTTERALQKLKRVTAVPAYTVEEILTLLREGKTVYYCGAAAAWGYSELESRGVKFEKIAQQRENKLYRLRKGAERVESSFWPRY